MPTSCSNALALLGLLLAVLIDLAVATAGTSGQDQTSGTEVREEISEALQAIGSYSAEQRDAAVAKAQEALAKTDARIEQLQQRIDQNWQHMNQAAREQARDTLKVLQQQRTDIAEWYGGLKHSSAKAWEEIKQGFAKSYSALEKSLEKAREDF
jgi:hypothetical protein